MKTISELEKEGYIGSDASLATSLFEYGMIAKEKENGDISFIYGIQYYEAKNHSGYNLFSSCSFSKEDIKGLQDESWVNMDSVKSWSDVDSYRFTDLYDYFTFISDMESYYGKENVFGSCYDGGFKVQAV